MLGTPVDALFRQGRVRLSESIHAGCYVFLNLYVSIAVEGQKTSSVVVNYV